MRRNAEIKDQNNDLKDFIRDTAKNEIQAQIYQLIAKVNEIKTLLERVECSNQVVKDEHSN